ATTDGAGTATWTFRGPCGVGAIAFLVDGATLGTRTLDRTRGRLADFVIPGTTTTSNQAPVASAIVSCSDWVCTFDATRSRDDVAITAYEWRDAAGALLSTQPTWSRAYASGNAATVVLTVFDAGGLSGSQTVTFDPDVWPATAGNLPVAVASVTCRSGGTCSFTGAGSYDPDGRLVAWRWTDNNGATLSTQPDFTQSYKRSGKTTVTLTVTDDDGLTASKSVQFSIRK
ncbi:MAG TPA: PKD domain-containing protein, partial [Albitalea sp.]